jgi:hypothetical protein
MKKGSRILLCGRLRRNVRREEKTWPGQFDFNLWDFLFNIIVT